MPERPAPNKFAVHTTGRLASRLGVAEQAALAARLVAQTPDVSRPPENLELELGMGNGLALLARAQANPAWQFWGVEVFLNGLGQALRQLERQPVPNAHLLNRDAREVLAQLPPGSVRRVLIPFPDPWPKVRHHKRRLVQPEVLDAVARVLAPGGELWVVTDWPDYAFHTLALLHAHPQLQLAQTLGSGQGLAAADCKPSARLGDEGGAALGPHRLAQAPNWWVGTKYQQKAEKAGRAAWFIDAVKQGGIK